MIKGPVVMAALFYASGIWMGSCAHWPLSWLFLAAWVLALLAWGKALWRPFLLWPLLFFAGWTNLSTRTAILSPFDLRLVAKPDAEYVTVRGTLVETPSHRVYERNEKAEIRSQARLEVEALGRDQQWRAARGAVAISTPGLLGPEFFAGQTVAVTGVLHPPEGPVAEGLFDYRTYLQWQLVYHQLRVESTNDWQVLRTVRASVSRPWADRFQNWAQATLARGLPAEDEALRLLWAMCLGWKTALTNEVSEPFMQTGTLHIFAISGLHIALIAGILVSLLRVLQWSRGICGLAVIPLIWFYTAATGWQSSAIRSTIMMSVIIAGWALERPSDLLNSLAAAGFIILVWEPQQLFQASFQLSFSVVMSIALMLPPLEKLRSQALKSDPFLPPELRPRWRRWLDAPLHHVSASLATSLAAWLGAMPLVAYYFYLITPVSLLANLIIVPLSSVALMSSLGSLICGDFLPALTELFNHSSWFWMRCMVWFSEWLARLPAAYFYVRPPRLIEFAGYYALLTGCMTGWLLRPSIRRWTALTIGLILAFYSANWARARNQVQLTVLPMRGGVLYIDAPGGRNDLLIDCGSESGAQFMTKPFLRAQGVNRLASLLLTHGDLAHVGGSAFLARQFSIAQIVTSPMRYRSTAYRQSIDKLEQSAHQWRRIRRGDQFGLWTVLHPEASDQFAQADDGVVTLRGVIHGTRILLLSDLGKRGQRALLEREKNLASDIVITSLPAQGEPLNNALLQAIRPRVIIVCTAEYPASARGNDALRQRLADFGVPVLYAHETGAITLTLAKSGWDLKTMSGRHLRGSNRVRLPPE